MILAIVLPIVLSNSSSNNPVFPVDHYNPYKVNDKDIQRYTSGITGVIRAPEEYNPVKHHLVMQRFLGNSTE